MAQTYFPDELDFELSPSRVDKNAAEQSNQLRHDDLLYILDSLERKLGVDESDDPTSVDYRLRAIEARIEELVEASAIADPGYRSGHQTLSAGGRQTILVPKHARTTNYVVSAYIIDSNRNPLQAVPYYDASQLVSSFDVDAADAGEIYWTLTPNDPTL